MELTLPPNPTCLVSEGKPDNRAIRLCLVRISKRTEQGKGDSFHSEETFDAVVIDDGESDKKEKGQKKTFYNKLHHLFNMLFQTSICVDKFSQTLCTKINTVLLKEGVI